MAEQKPFRDGMLTFLRREVTGGDKWSQRWLRIAPLNYTIREGARMKRIERVVLEGCRYRWKVKTFGVADGVLDGWRVSVLSLKLNGSE